MLCEFHRNMCLFVIAPLFVAHPRYGDKRRFGFLRHPLLILTSFKLNSELIKFGRVSVAPLVFW